MSLDQVVQLDGEERDIEQLILQLDHEDPLVAYAAKERVLRFMGASNEPSTKWIRCGFQWCASISWNHDQCMGTCRVGYY